MKKFILITEGLGPIELDATNQRDAIDEVLDDWTNGGRKTIECREYRLAKTTKISINTDYGEPVDKRVEK